MSLLRNRYIRHNHRILVDSISMTNGDLYLKSYKLLELFVTRYEHFVYIELQYFNNKTAIISSYSDIDIILRDNYFIVLEDEPEVITDDRDWSRYRYKEVYRNRQLELYLRKREDYQFMLARLVDKYNSYLDYSPHSIDARKHIERKTESLLATIREAIDILDDLDLLIRFRKEKLTKTVYDYNKRLQTIMYNVKGKTITMDYNVGKQINGGIITDIYRKDKWLVLFIDNNRHRYVNLNETENIKEIEYDRQTRESLT